MLLRYLEMVVLITNHYFDVLKEKKYSGWLVVEAEQDPAKANPFEYAKIGYKYLTETLNKSNIEIYKN